ncbi:MAG: hypothetical protein WBB19_19940 [Desulforhopalus sp.]
MGDFVQNVTKPPFGWGDTEWVSTGGDTTKSLVEQKFNSSISTAEEMLLKLVGEDGNSGYLGALNAIITDFSAPEIETLSITSPDLNITTDTRPTVDVGSLDTDFGTFDKAAPSLTALPAIDLSSLNPADLPEEITAAINWFEESHDITLFTDLITRLQTDLQAGATGLDPEVEQSIYDRAIARQDVEDARVQSETEDYFSARGFELPTGAMAGRLAEQANEIARNRTELNGKILEEQARLAQANSQFIIGASRDLEAVLRDFTSKKNDRSLDYAKAVAANAISIYAEQIRAYIAAAEANKAYVQVQVENLKAVVEFNKGLITQFAEEAGAYSVIVDAKAKKNKAITDIYQAEVDGYKAETEALSENQKILLGKYQADLADNELKLRTSIANAENIIKSYVAESSLREKVSSDMANIATQSVASAYGMVNMNVGMSHQTGRHQGENYSHGESRSVSYGQSESLNETHSFIEKA